MILTMLSGSHSTPLCSATVWTCALIIFSATRCASPSSSFSGIAITGDTFSSRSFLCALSLPCVELEAELLPDGPGSSSELSLSTFIRFIVISANFVRRAKLFFLSFSRFFSRQA